MSKLHATPRRFASLAAAALVLLAGACKDSTGVDDQEPEVASMRITFATGGTATVSSSGVVTGSISIPSGVARSFTVEFLNAMGQPDANVDATEFQVSVTPAAGITFARTGAFAGTITGATAGTFAVQFGLLHIEENHNDFGPFTVNIVVAAPPA
jgi:hypothetical protein